MFYNYYVYSQQPTCLMEFRCNFNLMPVNTFKFVASQQSWLLSLQVLVTSFHMLILQFVDT